MRKVHDHLRTRYLHVSDVIFIVTYTSALKIKAHGRRSALKTIDRGIMVHSVPTGQLAFSSRPVVRTVRYVIQLVNTKWENILYTEFASSYDLHLHGEKNMPEQIF